jgi:hypothetical protein
VYDLVIDDVCAHHARNQYDPHVFSLYVRTLLYECAYVLHGDYGDDRDAHVLNVHDESCLL